MRTVKIDDPLAEQGIGPGKPGAREMRRVVLVKGFMYETGACIGVAQPAQALADLRRVVAGLRVHHDGHRPDHAQPLMRATDALGGTALEEVGVVRTPYPLAGTLVHRIGA